MLPPRLSGTELRILGTSDLGAATVPLRASWGEAGTWAGMAATLEHERERGPALWLDAGDLVVGNPAYPLLGERPWAEVAALPIAAAAAGNHEFDDGLEALRAAAARLPFPMLCANADVGLPPATLLESEVGVIGLTHPRCDELTSCPPLPDDWPERVGPLARELRAGGARWVVALLHDGVEWWPEATGVGTRSRRLEDVARPWAEHIDLILCGHNFAGWTGDVAGTPAAQPHVFAGSMVVADLVGGRAVVRGAFAIPPVRPPAGSAAGDAIDACAARTAGETPHAWLTRTGAEHYLPDLVAEAFRRATGAGAGFALPSYHGTQAPLDGAIAAIGPGPVSELDLLRMCASPGYDPVVAELRPGELERAATAHWAAADPRNAATDPLPWNWCRMRAGTSTGRHPSSTVALMPAVLPHLNDWLGREIDAEPTGVAALDALTAMVS
jgi:hypothetical protein